MSDYMIRDVREDDAAELSRIYSYYVMNTAVSFEYEAPSEQEFGERIKKITAKYPYLVCEKDGRIAGYVYAGEYSSREAYSWTVAASIYVKNELRRHGIGTMLYAELEKRLMDMGIVNLLAGTAYCENEDEYLTHGSYDFHAARGFHQVARLETVGKKFGRWYDLVWMQKKIVEG